MDFEQVKDIVLAPGAIGAEVAVENAAARAACRDAAYAIFALTDFGQATRSLEHYAESIDMEIDGERFDRAARVERSRRREANVARNTRHLISNFLFRRVDARTAYALSLVTIFLTGDRTRSGAAPIAVADCADRFERGDDGRWTVTYRCLRTVCGSAH